MSTQTPSAATQHSSATRRPPKRDAITNGDLRTLLVAIDHANRQAEASQLEQRPVWRAVLNIDWHAGLALEQRKDRANRTLARS